MNEAAKIISEGFENILENLPKEVVRNTLWDITITHLDMKNAQKAFIGVYKKPDDFYAYLPYLEVSFGKLRLFRILIEDENINKKHKKKLKNLKIIVSKINDMAAPIVDDHKKDKELLKKILKIYKTLEVEIHNLWVETVKEWGIVDQLKSFKDRDMTEYVKNVMGFSPGKLSDGRELIVKHFIELTFKNFIDN